jgi:hypothetical protein
MADELLSDDNDQDGDDGLPSELEGRAPDTDTPPDEIDEPDGEPTA